MEKEWYIYVPLRPMTETLAGAVRKKILKKMDFGFDKAEKHAIFHPYAPEAMRLDEAVLKKNFEKNWEIDLTKWKSMLNYIPIAPDEGGDDCKSSDLWKLNSAMNPKIDFEVPKGILKS